MKIKTILVVALLASILSSGAKAQDTKAQDRPNVLKINIFALPLQNFSFQYERAFTHKSSLALGFSFMPSRNLPSVLTNADSSGTLKRMTISGFSFTPEYRWYPGSEDGAPNGFYLAPYLRYAKYSLNSTVTYTDNTSGKTYANPVSASYGGIGGGLMIGAQWLIKGKFSIDWWILGAHFGSGNADLKVIGDFASIPANARADLKTQLDDIAKSAKIGTATSEITNTSAGINWVGPFAGFRTGLTLGWAF